MLKRFFISKDVEGENRNTKNLYMLLLVVSALCFALLYYNRAATDWEGPDNFCALLMKDGKMMYRDFFYYIPPVYILRCLLTWSLFNGEILPLRFLGIAERVILFVIIYRILIRWFKPYVSYIACFLGFLLYNSLTFNSYGDYTQYAQIFVALSVLCVIYFDEQSEKSEKKACIWLAVASFFLVQSVMSKQSIGAAAIVFMFLGLLIYFVIKKTGKRTWKYLAAVISGTAVGVLPYAVWLTANGALYDFIDQVFLLSLNSKGLTSTETSTAEVTLLGRVFGAVFNTDSLIFDIFLSVFMVLRLIGSKIDTSRMPVRILKYASGICAVIFAGRILNIGLVSENIFNTLVYLGRINLLPYALILGAVMAGGLFISGHFFHSGKPGKERALIAVISVGIFISWIAMSCIPTEEVQGILDTFDLGTTIPGFYELFFHLGNVVLVVELVRWIVFRRFRYSAAFLFYVAALDANAVISLIGGGSATFSANGSLFVVPLAVCIICSVSFKNISWKKQAEGTVFGAAVASIFILSAVTMGQHLRVPYTWYGWTSEPITDATSYTIDYDRYTGMLVSKKTKLTLEEVTRLVLENSTSEDDFVFTFPGGKIYNILSNRIYMPTNVVYYMFDVCPDNYAIADAEILKKNKPDIIVWKDLGEEVWEEFETNYRNGGELGQREIQRWFDSVKDTEYTLVGQIYNESVYVINDGRDINYESFISEEETYSNIDEVYDNINNSDVFQRISEMFGTTGSAVQKAAYLGLIILAFVYGLVTFRLNRQYSTPLLIFTIVLGYSLYVSNVYFFIMLIPLLLWIFDERKRTDKISISVYALTGISGILLLFQWIPVWRQLKFVFYALTVFILLLSLAQNITDLVRSYSEKKGYKK